VRGGGLEGRLCDTDDRQRRVGWGVVSGMSGEWSCGVQATEAMRRALALNLGLVESFPRDVCILEDACNLFGDDKIRAYDMAAAAVRRALASVPDCMSTQVVIKDITKPNGELRKGVDTVVLRKGQVVELAHMLHAVQESNAEMSAVEWHLAALDQAPCMPLSVSPARPLSRPLVPIGCGRRMIC